MKVLYKCDYCEKTGTEEEILAHEKECINNPNNKTCITCASATALVSCKDYDLKSLVNFTCKKGIELPEGGIMAKNCELYEKREGKIPFEEDETAKRFNDLFGGLFKNEM